MPSSPGSSGPIASPRRSGLLPLRRFAEVALVYAAFCAALHFAAPLYSAAIAAALRIVVTIGEGDPPITTRVKAADADDSERLKRDIPHGAILVESKSYTELRTSFVPTSFHWSVAFYLALVFALLPATPFALRFIPAGIGLAILFLLHVAYAFIVIRVNTVANMGDISRVRFSDGARASLPHVMNFLKFAIDWLPIALWFVPFVRSGSLRRLLDRAPRLAS